LQGCGPRGEPRSEGKCEGMNLTLPRELSPWELESRWTFKCLERDFKDQNPMD